MKAQWLLENHKAHQSKEKLLAAQMKHHINLCEDESEKNFVIEGMALRRNPIDGMPPSTSFESKTESIAITYNDIIKRETEVFFNNLQSQLHQVRFYLLLYDAIIECLTDTERWLVESHYVQQLSFCDMLRNPPIGLKYTSKTGLYNKAQATLRKMDDILASVQIRKGQGDAYECLAPIQISLTS